MLSDDDLVTGAADCWLIRARALYGARALSPCLRLSTVSRQNNTATITLRNIMGVLAVVVVQNIDATSTLPVQIMSMVDTPLAQGKFAAIVK